MTIHLHIERLVLDGFDAGDPRQLQAALQAELTRLLAQGGLAPALVGGTRLASLTLAPATVQTAMGESTGRQIAAAVYGGIGA